MKNTKGKIACWCLAILAAVAVVAGIFCYVADLNIHAGELDLLASTEDILLGGADEMYYQGSYEADSLDNYDNGENDLVTENIEEDEILLEYNSETTDLLELDNSEDTSDILLEEADNTEELLLEESEDTTDLLLEESDVETELLLEEQSDETEMLLEEGEDVTALLLEESLSGNELQTEEQDDILSVSENGILSGKFALKGASSDIKIEIGENGDNVYGILSEAGELRIFGSGSTKVYYTSDKRPGFDEYKDKILKVICDDSIEVTDDPESGIKFSQVLFNECKNLEEVDLNGKVYAIDGYVFNGCSSLKTVTGLERVVSMGTASFKGCRNLESIEDTGNVRRIDSAAFYDCGKVSAFDFSSATFVGEDAFNLTALEEISLPNIEQVHKNAFANDSKLKKIEMDISKLTLFYESALESSGAGSLAVKLSGEGGDLSEVKITNNKISTITLEGFKVSKDYSLNAMYEDEATGNKFLVLQAGVLYNMTLVKSDDTEKEYELGKEGYESSIIGTLDTTTGTLTISADGDSADGVKMRDYESGTDENGSYYSTSPIYIDRSAINKIVFEDKIVTNFGNGVFIDCFNLTTVEIPTSVKNIGDYAFAGCIRLTGVTIPDETDIGAYAFAECSNLGAIHNMSGETNLKGMEIGEYAFKNAGLQSYLSLSSLKGIGNGAFEGCTLPKLRIGDVKCIDDTTVANIGINVIKDSQIKKLTISCYYDDVEYTIPSKSFAGSNIEELVFEDSVKRIGEYAFSNNIKLKSIDFGNVSYLDTNAFAGCTGLGEIILPRTIKRIDSSDSGSAFDGCSNVKEIVLKGVTFDKAVNLNAIFGADFIAIYEQSDQREILNELIADYEYTCTLVRSITTKYEFGNDVYGYFDDDIGLLEIAGSGQMYDETENLTGSATIYSDIACDIVTIKIYSGVSSVGNYMFYNLPRLANVILGPDVATLGRYSFGVNENLVSVQGAEGVTKIDVRCFSNCEKLMEVTTLESLKRIEEGAFYVCRNLSKIEAKEVEYIGAYAFEQANSLKRITGIENISNLGQKAFWFCNNLQTIDPLSNLEKIPSDDGLTCFYQCSKLAAVDLSKSRISEIPSDLFHSCDSLDYLSLPGSVTSIAQDAITGYAKLSTLCLNGITLNNDYILPGVYIDSTEAGLENPTEYTVLEAGVTYNRTLIKYSGSVTVQFGLNVFGEYDESNHTLSIRGYGPMFDYNSSYFTDRSKYNEYKANIENVVIGGSVTSVGKEMFNSLTNITNVSLPNTINLIDTQAFSGCSKLATINLDSNITNYGARAFEGCSVMAGPINAPELKSVGKYAFYNCSSLTGSINLSGLDSSDTSSAEIPEYAFYNCKALSNCDANTLANVCSIGKRAFYEATRMLNPKIDLSNLSGEKIEEEVFFHNYKSGATEGKGYLKEVTIGSNIKEIGKGAFRGNHDLETIIGFGSNITKVGGEAFKYCDLQGTLDCSGVEEIDYNAFQSNRKLVSLTDLSKLKHLGSYAFGGSSSLTGDYVLSSLEEVEVNTDGDSLALFGVAFNSVSVGGTIEVLPKHLFNSSNIKSITVSGNVATLAESCIDECGKLEEVIIGDCVTTISKGNFASCPKLSSVTLGSKVATVDADVFSDCTSLDTITLNNVKLNSDVKLPGYFYDSVDDKYINKLTAKKTYSNRTITKSEEWYEFIGIPEESEEVVLSIIVPYSEGKAHYYGKIEGYIDYFVNEGDSFVVKMGDGNRTDKTTGIVTISDDENEYDLKITLNKTPNESGEYIFDGTNNGTPLPIGEKGYREEFTIELSSDGNKVPDPTVVFNGLLHISVSHGQKGEE